MMMDGPKIKAPSFRLVSDVDRRGLEDIESFAADHDIVWVKDDFGMNWNFTYAGNLILSAAPLDYTVKKPTRPPMKVGRQGFLPRIKNELCDCMNVLRRQREEKAAAVERNKSEKIAKEDRRWAVRCDELVSRLVEALATSNGGALDDATARKLLDEACFLAYITTVELRKRYDDRRARNAEIDIDG
jgi:hypothetical protein